MRTESDALGDVPVPKDALYGISTARSLTNFSISDEKMPEQFIQHYAALKACAATVNAELGLIEQSTADTIIIACSEIEQGQHLEQFPLSIWQSGSGTQTNMNINEVIANRANQILGQPLGKKSPIHPNDHVNQSQSSNDTFPACMHICFVSLIHGQLLPNLKLFKETLERKSDELSENIHIGRTHLQDALPISFKQNFQTYVAFVEQTIEQLHQCSDDLSELPLGGTAVGTGFGSPPGFAAQVARTLSKKTQLPFHTAKNPSKHMSQHQALLSLSACLNNFAACYLKMSNDLRLLGSGPRAGLSELILPNNELGSSIMPGKVNPTQCESAAMVCLSIIGNHNTITQACSHGHLELNTYKPLILHYLYQSCTRIADSIFSFTHLCLKNLTVNESICTQNIKKSLMLVTALSPHIGYDQCAKLATHAYQNDITLRQAVLKLGIMSAEEFDRITDPKNML